MRLRCPIRGADRVGQRPSAPLRTLAVSPLPDQRARPRHAELSASGRQAQLRDLARRRRVERAETAAVPRHRGRVLAELLAELAFLPAQPGQCTMIVTSHLARLAQTVASKVVTAGEQ